MRRAILPLLCAAVLAACKAGPAKPSGYLDEKGKPLSRDTRFPFQRVWYKRDIQWERYTKLHVAPVNTRYLEEMGWWDKLSPANARDRRQSAAEIAAYLREAIVKAFREDKKKVVQVVDEPKGAGVLVLETALVELVPTKAWLNAAGYAGVMMALDKGTIAIEGRLKDASTGEVLAMFADREAGKDSLLDAQDLTWWGHAREAVDDWAKQMVQVAHAEEWETVDDSWSFKLRPW